MAETTGNARIFEEMRSADALRQTMRQSIVERFRSSGVGHTLGQAYDSDMAQGVVGGLRDAYRRIFEQGAWGKDVFDGRWHMDNQVGQDRGGIHGMKEQYDTRAAFYGWDQSQDNGQEAERTKAQEHAQQQEREQGMER